MKNKDLAEKEIKERLKNVLEQNKEEFIKGFNEAISWGTECYSLDNGTKKLKFCPFEKLIDLADNLDLTVVSIIEYPSEVILKQWEASLTSEELEKLEETLRPAFRKRK